MKKVLNVSKVKDITIDGVTIKPLQSHVFSNLSAKTLRQLNALQNVGSIKLFDYTQKATTTTTTQPMTEESKTTKKKTK